jgi:hypothetical protein
LVCGWRQWCAWIIVTMTFIILPPNLDKNRLIPLLSHFFLIPSIINTFTDLVCSFASNPHRFCGNLITIWYLQLCSSNLNLKGIDSHTSGSDFKQRKKIFIQKKNGRLPDSALL